ncbi:hypothetical protein PGTUg99_004886 [Puccinia graminis f. sp. tritici]|uniref:Uncharacterized protein n=1 Tax=Puccinia graminis f. sp. tritici TaxID=56615 RepID=A0A5B0P7U4_PUCGR|nr:hypothetical protein PGTUg99_004886 [Puccinia graminis f. sp. tritici]
MGARSPASMVYHIGLGIHIDWAYQCFFFAHVPCAPQRPGPLLLCMNTLLSPHKGAYRPDR